MNVVPVKSRSGRAVHLRKTTNYQMTLCGLPTHSMADVRVGRREHQETCARCVQASQELVQ